jgi:hypothetical protein
VRRNHLALVALFLAITGGSAYALAGRNTVTSDDIVEGQVKSQDVAGAQSVDFADDTLTGGGLTRADLAPASVGSSEVADDSLGEAQIDESTLGAVPEAGLGGRGYSASVHGLCLPGGTYSTCISRTIDVPQATRLLVTVAGRHREYSARCRIGAGIFVSPEVVLRFTDGTNFMYTTVVPVLTGDFVSVEFQCLSISSGSPARLSDIHLSIVELSPT